VSSSIVVVEIIPRQFTAAEVERAWEMFWRQVLEPYLLQLIAAGLAETQPQSQEG